MKQFDFAAIRLNEITEARQQWAHWLRGPFLRVALLCLLVGLGAAGPVRAGHFRYGSLTWSNVASDPSHLTEQFKVSQSWRRSFSAFANVTVGSTVTTDVLDFGDGTSTDIHLTVTSVDLAGDSFYGEATISHAYAAAGNFRAFFTNCCRLSTLSNNASGSWYVNSLVNAGSTNNSPVSTVAPVVNLAVGQMAATFRLPVNDPDGDALSFALATQADFNGFPFTNAPNLAVNPTTGVVTFNTAFLSVGQMFNAVIKVSDGQTSILVDFLLSVTGTSVAPVFDYSITPPNGYVYRLVPGQSLTFGVRASDSDANDVVRLFAFGLPQGAAVAPALPTDGNPVQTTFSWTPTAANLGTTVINFVAQDLAGVQAATFVTVDVSLRPVFDVPPTPANGSAIQTTPGTALSYAIQASAPSATDRVRIVSATGLPAAASFGPALPSPAANPTRTQLSWTPVLADWGPHAAVFTARNLNNEQATHTLNFIINSAPSFTSQPGGLTVVAGQVFRYNITATDPDLPYGDRLALLASVLPSWLRLTDNGNGTATLMGTPTAAQVGAHRVTLDAEDIYHHGNSYGFVTQSFVINVIGCNVLLATTPTDPSCINARSGSIMMTVSGATAPYTCAWTGPNGFQSAAPNLKDLAAGTYNVTVTDANRCTAAAAVTLTAPKPAATPTTTTRLNGTPVDAAAPTTIYLGYGPQTATLKASAADAVRYSWSPAAGLSSASVADPVFAPTAAGRYVYTVTATNAAGCAASASITLSVVEARCGNKNDKVLVCHNGHEICISVNALPAHIGPKSNHQDVLGSCSGSAVVSAAARTQPALVLETFPNPLTSSSTVHFRSTETAATTVKVYNQMGKLVATLFDGVADDGEDYLLALDATAWPTGIYLCRFVSKGQTHTQNLVVSK